MRNLNKKTTQVLQGLANAHDESTAPEPAASTNDILGDETTSINIDIGQIPDACEALSYH